VRAMQGQLGDASYGLNNAVEYYPPSWQLSLAHAASSADIAAAGSNKSASLFFSIQPAYTDWSLTITSEFVSYSLADAIIAMLTYLNSLALAVGVMYLPFLVPRLRRSAMRAFSKSNPEMASPIPLAQGGVVGAHGAAAWRGAAAPPEPVFRPMPPGYAAEAGDPFSLDHVLEGTAAAYEGLQPYPSPRGIEDASAGGVASTLIPAENFGFGGVIGTRGLSSLPPALDQPSEAMGTRMPQGLSAPMEYNPAYGGDGAGQAEFYNTAYDASAPQHGQPAQMGQMGDVGPQGYVTVAQYGGRPSQFDGQQGYGMSRREALIAEAAALRSGGTPQYAAGEGGHPGQGGYDAQGHAGGYDDARARQVEDARRLVQALPGPGTLPASRWGGGWGGR